MDKTDLIHRVWTRCRDVAVALMAACWPGRGFSDVEAWLTRAPPPMQRGVVLGVLAALFGLSVVAAQFGLIGLCVFWLIIIWLIR